MIYDIQKASILKRISAFLLDLIILSIATTGFMFAITAICNYDSYQSNYSDAVKKIEQEQNFSIEQYEKMSEQEKQENSEKLSELLKALNADDTVISNYSMIISIQILSVSLGLFLSFLIFEFIVPLIFGNGQSVGKKIFSICVVKRDSVKIDGVVLFIRAMIGKYVIGVMIPLLLVAVFSVGIVNPYIIIVGFFGLLLAQIITFIFSGYHQMLHDVLTVTVVVDKSTQMIFASQEELLEYKKKIHSELAEKAAY